MTSFRQRTLHWNETKILYHFSLGGSPIDEVASAELLAHAIIKIRTIFFANYVTLGVTKFNEEFDIL